jgi:SAM-dependent methyltransferase
MEAGNRARTLAAEVVPDVLPPDKSERPPEIAPRGLTVASCKPLGSHSVAMDLPRLEALGSRVMTTAKTAVIRRISPERTLNGDSAVPGLRFPPDVIDREALRAQLRQTDLFGAAEHESEAYLADALDRFRITMALLPQLPRQAKVLELGANPYFLTRILRQRGLAVTCANWFGESWAAKGASHQVVTESGVPTTYEFDHFNLECDPFPYPDGEFDLVLFCEILEHLPTDPIHPLVEMHRVLRPGGSLLLTTPNSVRLDNLRRMMRAENVYETLSGYGVYGRHNREYTTAELELLLTGCGYQVVRAFDADIGHTQEPLSIPESIEAGGRGANLFALATKVGRRRWQYPNWLFSSTHALRRCVMAGVEMGVNCDLQSDGLYDLETFADGRQGRWTGDRSAELLLVAPASGPQRIVVEGVAPPARAGAALTLRMGIAATPELVSWTVPCDGGPFTLAAAVDLPAGQVTVMVSTDRTWQPSEVSDSADGRRLGLILSSVRLEAAGRNEED